MGDNEKRNKAPALGSIKLQQTSATASATSSRPSGDTIKTKTRPASAAVAPPRARLPKLLSVPEKIERGLIPAPSDRERPPLRPRRAPPATRPATAAAGSAAGSFAPGQGRAGAGAAGISKIAEITPLRIQHLERAMVRCAVKGHSVREDDVVRLTRIFAGAIWEQSGREPDKYALPQEDDPYSVRPHFVRERPDWLGDGSGLISVSEFLTGWAALGLKWSADPPTAMAEARALVARYPNVREGPEIRCRFAPFARQLFRGAQRAAGNQPLCQGYPVTDEHYQMKIVYPHCRTPVYSPQPWLPEIADASLLEPEAKLELKHVYGAPKGPLSSLCTGEVVYYTAAAAVILDPATLHQRFFLAHTNDVSCLAVCAAATELGGVSYPGRSLVATGQQRALEDATTAEKECPFVCIWDSRTAVELVRIPHDPESRAVVAAAFSPDGRALATVTCDNRHTVTLWDWRAPRCGAPPPRAAAGAKPRGWLAEGGGFQDRPVAVLGVAWDAYPRAAPRVAYPEGTPAALAAAQAAAAPGAGCAFATHGRKHLRVWSVGRDGAYSSSAWSFGKIPMNDVMAAVFLPPPKDGAVALATGAANGDVLLWRAGAAVTRIAAHPLRAAERPTDAPFDSLLGVRCLLLLARGRVLVTGGGDGAIRSWDVDAEGFAIKPLGALALPSVPGALPTQLCAADQACHPIRTDTGGGGGGGGRGGGAALSLLVSTSAAAVWEVPLDPLTATPLQQPPPRQVGDGLREAPYFVAWHPGHDRLWAAVSDGGEVALWSDATRQRVRGGSAGFPCRSVAISPRPMAPPSPFDAGYGGGGGGGGEVSGSHHLAVGGLQGQLLVLDEGTLEPIFELTLGASMVADLKYSPDGALLAAACSDTRVSILRARRREQGPYQLLRRCEGHSAAVRHLDWAADGAALASTGHDREILVWDPTTARQLASDTRNTKWQTWTSILGFPAIGIWPDDGADSRPLSLDRSADGQLLAVSDDRCRVRLYRCPAASESAAHRTGRAHGSFVVCVRFDGEGRRLLTAGSSDGTVMQWECVKEAPPPPPPEEPPTEWLPLDDAGRFWGFRQRRPDDGPVGQPVTSEGRAASVRASGED